MSPPSFHWMQFKVKKSAPVFCYRCGFLGFFPHRRNASSACTCDIHNCKRYQSSSLFNIDITSTAMRFSSLFWFILTQRFGKVKSIPYTSLLLLSFAFQIDCKSQSLFHTALQKRFAEKTNSVPVLHHPCFLPPSRQSCPSVP